MSIDEVRDAWNAIDEQTGRVVIGQHDTVKLLMVALLSQGHVLLEGVPGTAKTLLSRTFAACLGLEFRRIQFTPDLMPGDILGTHLFDFQTGRFTLTRGPVFTEFLLADEINRTPPKTQAALLGAMQERTVTIDGTTHPLSGAFLVLATQNPIEHEGTYPLPEAQLDRFLFKILVGYPERDDELKLVGIHGHHSAMPPLERFGLRAVTDPAFLERARAQVAALRLADEIVAYIVDLVRATRTNPALQVGASPRACNMLATAARSLAVLEGRDFVIPDDVKSLVLPVLRHRIVVAPAAEVEGRTAEQVLQQIVQEVPAPR
ncbi:MAG: MoxR family ATPase [Candidatus Eisenbacteria bacterium]|uniref:MoxR family ATPase n=1 Tax=Eiseniibacteriota bacterium TaxID=2212470 RepID=A0A933W960_UNCEI|nr:MoxR family ATPase [Candidatus Eisenbacteria bacterium]